MAVLTSALRLWACAFLLCASSTAFAQGDPIADIQKQLETLRQQQGKYTVNTGSLAIESWLLTSTAINSTADKIRTWVTDAITADVARAEAERIQREAIRKAAGQPPDADESVDTQPKKILVVTAAEPLEFGQVAMLSTEMDALTKRLVKVCECAGPARTTEAVPALIGAVAGLLKSDTELTAIDQTVDAKLLASAVANHLEEAVLPSAAITGGQNSALIVSFSKLVDTADKAQVEYDRISTIPEQKDKAAKLKVQLGRYDSFYTRVTTANANGVVPLAYAARLQDLIKDNPYVLRVNTEKAGGTLLKRTNLWTALGAESAFVSGGLVSSYQLTDPADGRVVAAGVVTCRTTLTSLKHVQQGSWTNSARQTATAICLP